MGYDVAGVKAVVDGLKDLKIEAAQYGPSGANDGVACFTYLYTIITENVLRCVEGVALEPGDPIFNDPEFMACFDIVFAERYFAAMGKGDKPPFQPRCWEALLTHRETAHISPMVFAVAGVNAHVNFDLPFALITACQAKGKSIDDKTVYNDYQMINQIFCLHMQQLRQHFEDNVELEFDHGIVTQVENLVGDFLVRVTRDRTWKKAQRMWPFRADKATMLRFAVSRDRAVDFLNEALFDVDHFLAPASQ